MVEYAIKTPSHHGTWQQFLELWQTIDDCEIYSQAWNFDHFYAFGSDLYPVADDQPGPCLESWTMLAALAQATCRIRIGSMVNAMHHRHPAVTANMATTLDIISGGRLDLGLGAGWNVEESEAYGIDLGSVKQRLDRFEEGVEVIVRLLSQHTTDFTGDYYRVTDAHCEPKAIQRPHPPLLIGGGGRTRTLPIVAKWAQKWDGGFRSVTDWQDTNEALVECCEEVGRDPFDIQRTIHLPWDPGVDLSMLADRAAELAAAGLDQVIFNMQRTYAPADVEALGAVLAER
ncbi:MAG TPA: LLM class F420-dependent oxidoreductase [Acidimicrobiaceae bacterium]|jgi:F420-dependent oxidoreductase-like protein|nr:LLM class F420-dependent oxidoreductase [Acidimicrobiaceae bacterium]|tara:strand:+ start:1054 stop:1914 length:861 start_codon:yes stop_codon:yes gene_type:complete